MLWSTLWRKIGKQPLSFSQHNHVYAVLLNEYSGRYEKVYLNIKYDAKGHPYFVKAEKQN